MAHVRSQLLLLLLALGLLGCRRAAPVNIQEAEAEPAAFTGARAGDRKSTRLNSSH